MDDGVVPIENSQGLAYKNIQFKRSVKSTIVFLERTFTTHSTPSTEK